jgi:hypothetical protein
MPTPHGREPLPVQIPPPWPLLLAQVTMGTYRQRVAYADAVVGLYRAKGLVWNKTVRNCCESARDAEQFRAYRWMVGDGIDMMEVEAVIALIFDGV